MEKLSHGPLSAEPEVVTALADHRALAMRIKRSVRRHSGGGVKALEVHVDHETIRLGGRCASFYCKQLAQHAAMRLSGGVQVINGIEVECQE
jgi:osmotically-inducible protein OsmY